LVCPARFERAPFALEGRKLISCMCPFMALSRHWIGINQKEFICRFKRHYEHRP
jgi:hypothetical protein